MKIKRKNLNRLIESMLNELEGPDKMQNAGGGAGAPMSSDTNTSEADPDYSGSREMDVSTIDMKDIEDLADGIFDKLEKFKKISGKLKLTDGSGGGVSRYLGGYEKAVKILDTRTGYTGIADDIFHFAKDDVDVIPQRAQLEKLKGLAENLLKKLEEIPQLGGTADKMFGMHGLGGLASQPGISKEEYGEMKVILKEVKQSLRGIINRINRALPDLPSSSDPGRDITDSADRGQSEQEPSDFKPSPGKPVAAKKKKPSGKGWKGFVNRAPDSDVAQKIADLWEELARDDNSYKAFQKWYNTVRKTGKTGSPFNVVTLAGGKRPGKNTHFNPKEILKILIDMKGDGYKVREKMISGGFAKEKSGVRNPLKEGLSRGSLYRMRYRRY